jgi:hypothetical protein
MPLGLAHQQGPGPEVCCCERLRLSFVGLVHHVSMIIIYISMTLYLGVLYLQVLWGAVLVRS